MGRGRLERELQFGDMLNLRCLPNTQVEIIFGHLSITVADLLTSQIRVHKFKCFQGSSRKHKKVLKDNKERWRLWLMREYTPHLKGKPFLSPVLPFGNWAQSS